MKFKTGVTYLTRNGKAVEIVRAGSGTIYGRFVRTGRSELWDAEGRHCTWRKSPIDLTEAVCRTAVQDGGPLVTPTTATLTTAQFVNKPAKVAPVSLKGETLYAAELVSKYPDQPFFSPLFLSKPEVTRFCSKYNHKIVAELTVTAARS